MMKNDIKKIEISLKDNINKNKEVLHEDCCG